MDVRERLRELAKFQPAATPVVSVYLNTEWVDEHQRERARIFLKNALAEASVRGWAAREDLDWIEAQGRALIERVAFEDANGVVLFACQAAGLREALPLRVPSDDIFVVDQSPYVRPLAGIVDDTPPALVIFVDGTSARLIALDPSGVAGETLLEADLEGRHRRGGWAARAQSRYQRHVQAHRDQHFEAVAAAAADWVGRYRAQRIVLAGDPRMLAALSRHLPEPLATRIAGRVTGTRWEPASAIAARAAALLARVEVQADEHAVQAALDDAARGGPAVTGADATVGAANRGAVSHLYVLRAFQEPAAVCPGCGTLQRGVHFTCAFCGATTRTTELGEALAERVLAAGGEVTTLDDHRGLAKRGGVAARLRYAA